MPPSRIRYIAATLFPLSAQERSQLESSDIKCIRIGPKFEEWKRTLRDAAEKPEVEV